MACRRLLAMAFAVALGAAPGSAQDTQAGPAPRPDEGTAPAVQSPILTLDQDRLYAQTFWGKRAAARVAAVSEALAAENRQIEADLTAEEKRLTDERAAMPAADFRTAADDFDKRVVGIRRTQDGKARAIGILHDTERQRFFTAALPVMAEVLRRRGALVVLDHRAIFVAADAIDVTDEMVRQIDAALGPGSDIEMPEMPPDPGESPQEGQLAPQPGLAPGTVAGSEPGSGPDSGLDSGSGTGPGSGQSDGNGN